MDIQEISDRLLTYLRVELNNPNIEYASPLEQLHGGYETSTFKFKITRAGDELSDYLTLRLYPQYYGSHNAVWENTVQNILAESGFPVAKAVFVCSDMTVLGGAFFIMAYIPGQLLMFTPAETIPVLLGQTHAELHKVDPQPLIASLTKKGIDPYAYGNDSRSEWLTKRVNQYPWIADIARWLQYNCPAEPEELAICHGDLHPLNILVDNGQVSGVLDWPGFAITDPVFDVANTIMLVTIPARIVSQSIEGFPPIDWDQLVEMYLSSYQTIKPLNKTNLAYYQVRRCAMALIQGIEGQQVWQHPMIVADMIRYIHSVTGILVAVPA